jgi:hypothetical protein
LAKAAAGRPAPTLLGKPVTWPGPDRPPLPAVTEEECPAPLVEALEQALPCPIFSNHERRWQERALARLGLAADPSTTRGLFALYAQAGARFAVTGDELRSFVSAVARTNVSAHVHRSPWEQERVAFQRAQAAADSAAERLVQVAGAAGPALTLPVLGAPEAALPVSVLAPRMEEAFRGAVKARAAETVRVLDSLRAAELVGGLTWYCPGVARYHSYAWRLTDHAAAARSFTQGVSVVTEQDVRRDFTHTLLTHDLIDATSTPVAAYRGRVPKRVTRLLHKTPPWILPLLRVVDGTEVARGMFESLVGSQTRTERNVMALDPALTLFDFVLTAWDESEAKRG